MLIKFTASRELYEETGEIKCDTKPVYDYSVSSGDVINLREAVLCSGL